MSDGVSHIEAQARRFLWLFPAWLRTGRGEEAIALVLDLLGAEARRLTWRARRDLVRAGLHARRRGTPPLRIWLKVGWAEPGRPAYVGEHWRPWLLAGLGRRWFYVPVNLARMAPITFVMGGIFLASAGTPSYGWLVVPLALSASLVPIRWRARRASLYLSNGCDGDGTALPSHLLASGFLPARVANLPVTWVAAAAAVPPAVLALLGRLDRSLDGPVGWLQPLDPAGASSGRMPVLVVPAMLAGLLAARRAWISRHGTDVAAPERELSWKRWASTASVFGGWCLGAGLYGAFMADAHSGVGAEASLALAAGVAWLVVVVTQRLIGRSLGVWDMVPSLGPRRCLVWAQPRHPELPPPPAMWLR